MLVCHAITSVPDIAAAIAQAPQEIMEESFIRIETMRTRFQPPTAYSAAALNELDKGNTELRTKTGLSTGATGPVPAT
jgi:hypothetical protein